MDARGDSDRELRGPKLLALTRDCLHGDHKPRTEAQGDGFGWRTAERIRREALRISGGNEGKVLLLIGLASDPAMKRLLESNIL